GCEERASGFSTYLRLSTKPVDQSLIEPVLARLGETELRRQVLAGGYRLIDRCQATPEIEARYVVQLAAVGALVPEAIAAAGLLHDEGVAANVLCLTGPSLLYRGLKKAREQHLAQGTSAADAGHLGQLIPPDERHAPIVTIHDAASH